MIHICISLTSSQLLSILSWSFRVYCFIRKKILASWIFMRSFKQIAMKSSIKQNKRSQISWISWYFNNLAFKENISDFDLFIKNIIWGTSKQIMIRLLGFISTRGSVGNQLMTLRNCALFCKQSRILRFGTWNITPLMFKNLYNLPVITGVAKKVWRERFK